MLNIILYTVYIRYIYIYIYCNIYDHTYMLYDSYTVYVDNLYCWYIIIDARIHSHFPS